MQDLDRRPARAAAPGHPGLRVVIAGDGPHRTELQEDVRRLRLQRAVSFAGFMGEGELPALMAATDALVVPSIYEPFGMVALEAASAGAPLAVAATGGLAEIVEPGETGVTFPAKSPEALAAPSAPSSRTSRSRAGSRRRPARWSAEVRLVHHRGQHRRRLPHGNHRGARLRREAGRRGP